MLLNESLSKIRSRSFFLDGELVCDILVLFFEMSLSGWISLTISEGVCKFESLSSDPEVRGLLQTDDQFTYPVKELDVFDSFLGMTVRAIYEYEMIGIAEGCIGVYMDFGENGLSVMESDDCLSITEGLVDFDDKEISLREIKL